MSIELTRISGCIPACASIMDTIVGVFLRVSVGNSNSFLLRPNKLYNLFAANIQFVLKTSADDDNADDAEVKNDDILTNILYY
jgi:hypothetical protein